MEERLFEEYRNLIYKESGIVLGPDKLYLLVNRIQKRLRELNLKNEKQYLEIIEIDATGEELVKLIDAISTNLTYFYREPQHYEIFRRILNQFKQEGRNDLKLWCAAASSGEEPYNIAMEASEVLDSRSQNFRLLATDICTKVLKKAINGVYQNQSVEKIPTAIRNKYLTKLNNTEWSINENIKNHVTFKKFNLVKFPYALKGNFDVIFCRNVMIYFDLQTREKVVNELYSQLRPGGYLFISLSESLLGMQTKFEKYEGSVFIKR